MIPKLKKGSSVRILRDKLPTRLAQSLETFHFFNSALVKNIVKTGNEIRVAVTWGDDKTLFWFDLEAVRAD